VRAALLAGLAIGVIAGSAELAQARTPEQHILTIQLPGGGVERIRYSGDVPPRIVMAPMADPFTPMMAVAAPESAPAWASPFAVLDRISAEMDQQAAIMLHEAAAMAAGTMPGLATGLAPDVGADGLVPAGLGALPPDGQTRLFMVNLGDGADLGDGQLCARSVTITSRGPGEAPQVVQHVSGACGGSAGAAVPARQVVPDETDPHGVGPLARTIQVKATPVPLDQIVRPAVWTH
jgi:hypothetical protein